MMSAPDVDAVLDGLKDFQRRTVDYVFRRLYLDDEPVRRFLIADEVGLGKTLVARGVVAKAVAHLWDKRERIDVIYVCSNGDIARQNANRLTLPGVKARVMPSRITLMPKVVKTLDRKLNFVSITPGTSFNLRSSSGTAEERALMYVLLEEPWEFRGVAPRKVLAGYSGFDRFKGSIASARLADIDQTLGDAFVKVASEDEALRHRFDELCEEIRFVRRSECIPPDLYRRRNFFIGDLRRLMAGVCLQALEPDVVILDEFQRFKHLIAPEETGNPALDDMRELAQEFMNHPDASVLMLSATPYKMYTLPDEQASEDHYEDLKLTLGFLIGDKSATAEVVELLGDYGRQLLAVPRRGAARLVPLRRELERRLLQVMVRTERLAVSTDRNGMLGPAKCRELAVRARDLRDYVTLQQIAGAVGQPDMLEYWKSAPYLLNFMDDYKVKQEFTSACERDDSQPQMCDILRRRPEALIDWAAFERYAELDPANPRLRSLMRTMLDDPLWQLLWVPPSLPYYGLSGPFAAAAAKGFTKRLVFSSWTVVPKVIAAMLSYEAERRMVRGHEDEPENSPEARKRRAPLLRFAKSRGRLTGMPVLALIYPSTTLAELADPLTIGGGRERDDVLRDVEAAVEELLALLPDEGSIDDPVDDDWYWAAPVMLDMMTRHESTESWLMDAARLQSWGVEPEAADDRLDGPRLAGDDHHSPADADADEEDRASAGRAFAEHVEVVRAFVRGEHRLGRRPPKLALVLARMALAAPGVVALRALARICGGASALTDDTVKTAAARIAWSYRNLFNTPEPMAIVRGLKEQKDGSLPYWRQVLRYGVDGCLQAVFDEYVHILRESQGLLDQAPSDVAEAVAKVFVDVLSMRTASLHADAPQISDDGTRITSSRQSMRAHYALRFGDERAESGKTLTRAATVREAFNSPFWPFVVATTSMGQEGLDFHCYCHAVVHWNLPSNPVDLEQREGRVHRYKGHAVRKNLAAKYGLPGVLAADRSDSLWDPWERLFRRAQDDRGEAGTDLVPYWVYPLENGARIERYVPALPLSRDGVRLESLLRSLVVYRAAIGQPRQQDVVDYLLRHVPAEQVAVMVDELRLDLSPHADASSLTDARTLLPGQSPQTVQAAHPDGSRASAGSSSELDRVARDLAAAHWIFAETMPENPHEYTLRREWASDAGFVRAVRFIRAHGYQNLFQGRWYTQLDLGEHTYWTLGAPVEETILINRKPIPTPEASTAAG